MRFGAAPPLGVSPSRRRRRWPKRGSRAASPCWRCTSATPWWAGLVAEPELSVFAALPCLESLGPQAALAVANVAVEPTERDETYWVSDADEPAPRDRACARA